MGHELRLCRAKLALDGIGARIGELGEPKGRSSNRSWFHDSSCLCTPRAGKVSQHVLFTRGAQYVVTGSATDRVLEAGHLFSYAELGSHHAHGGLLLRRDIRRLFDDGLLAVNPGALHVYVAPDLAIHAHYAALHGTR